jgi:hypothetical protein
MNILFKIQKQLKMKKTILFATIALTLVSIIGCKKEETSSSKCLWNSSTLAGKTYKLTKVIIVSNGVTTDATSTYLTQPCANNTSTLTATTYTTTLASGCNASETSGTYTTTTENGKNYYTTTPTGSTISSKQEVSSFDCNSFTTVQTTQSVGTVYITLSKI